MHFIIKRLNELLDLQFCQLVNVTEKSNSSRSVSSNGSRKGPLIKYWWHKRKEIESDSQSNERNSGVSYIFNYPKWHDVQQRSDYANFECQRWLSTKIEFSTPLNSNTIKEGFPDLRFREIAATAIYRFRKWLLYHYVATKFKGFRNVNGFASCRDWEKFQLILT